MRGFSSRLPSSAASIVREPSSVTGYLLARPQWQDKAVEKSQIDYVEEHIILCGVLKSTAQKLQSLLPNKQWACLAVEKAKNVAHRYSQGLQMNGSYTFSKNLDTISGVQTAGDTNAGPNSIPLYGWSHLYKGPSAFDSRHVFSFNSTYALPIGPGRPTGLLMR